MKENLKWLLLLPVAIGLAAVMIIFIPRILSNDESGGSDASTTSEQSQLSPEELADYQSRIDIAASLVAANPTDILALKELALAYEDMARIQAESKDVNGMLRNYKNAVDQFRKYLALNPADNEVRNELGMAYVEMNLADLGERELRTITTNAPTDQRAWLSLGVSLATQGKTAEAISAWQTSYNLAPTTDVGITAKQYLDEITQTGSSGP